MNNFDYKYKLSIISVFKNEATILESWLQHYIDEGVEHFYLIDNGSTDNFKSRINRFMHKITLVSDSTRFPAVNNIGPQQYLQNKYFLDKVKKESEWVFICDIDEYLYNKNSKYISDYLNKTTYNYIKIYYVYYGSTLENTPSCLPTSLIKCQHSNPSNTNYININDYGWKTILKTNILTNIDCHNHIVNNNAKKTDLNYCDDLILNHYQNISKDYYFNVRCKRGGGVHGLTGRYVSGNNIDYYNKKNKTWIVSNCDILHDKKNMLKWWNIYVINYSDLKFTNFNDAWIHWVKHGKKEKRMYKFRNKEFNWENYINRYPDLKKNLKYTKESAWEHYLKHGKRENRKIN